VKNVADPGVGDVNVPVCRCLIKEDCITVLRTLGIGEFGVVQHAVWTKDTAQQVWLSVCLSVCSYHWFFSHVVCIVNTHLFGLQNTWAVAVWEEVLQNVGNVRK